MRIAFVVTGGVDRSGRESVTPDRWPPRPLRLRAAVARSHLHYPLVGATIRDLGSPRGLRRQYDALVDALRRDGPVDVVNGYQALPSGLTRDKRRSVWLRVFLSQ